MPSEFPFQDPRNLWQNQPTEGFKMSASEVRFRAEQLQEKARLGALVWMTMGPALSILFAFSFARSHEMLPRLGWGVLSLWAIYGAYHAYRWIWPGRLPADASTGTTVEYYRIELERRRDYGEHIWSRSGFVFAFLGLALLVAHWTRLSQLPNATPFLTLLGVWVVAFFYMRKRGGRMLQREIDQLAAFERENKAGS